MNGVQRLRSVRGRSELSRLTSTDLQALSTTTATEQQDQSHEERHDPDLPRRMLALNFGETRHLRSVKRLPELPQLDPISLSIRRPNGAREVMTEVSHDAAYEAAMQLADLVSEPSLSQNGEQSSEEQSEDDEIYASLASAAQERGFAPPPRTEVAEYSHMRLPPKPRAKRKGRIKLFVESRTTTVGHSVQQSTTIVQPRDELYGEVASIHGEFPDSFNRTKPVEENWASRVSRRDTANQRFF